MTTSRSACSLASLALLWTFCVSAGGQKVNTPRTSEKPQVMFLDFRSNGQSLVATVGQQIEISLAAISGCEPVVSSPSIRLESVALEWSPLPGFQMFFYIFHAASPGEAQVRIPITDCSNPDLPGGRTFAARIRVSPSDGELSTPYASKTPDQVNSAPWAGAWTIVLSNDLRQSFTPSLPKLTGVELELVAGNPGPANSEVTVTLRSAKGEILSVVSKTVPADDCGHVLFVFPKGGWPVSPGDVYSIEVHGDGVFGWKYVVGGYSRGSASFNGKPLLQGARSTFLFRTFGAS